MSTFLSRITLNSSAKDTSLSRLNGTPSVTSFTQDLPHPPPSYQLMSPSNPMPFSNKLTRSGDQRLQLGIRSSRILPTYCPPVSLPLNLSAHLPGHVFVVFVDCRHHPPLGRRLIYPPTPLLHSLECQRPLFPTRKQDVFFAPGSRTPTGVVRTRWSQRWVMVAFPPALSSSHQRVNPSTAASSFRSRPEGAKSQDGSPRPTRQANQTGIKERLEGSVPSSAIAHTSVPVTTTPTGPSVP
jgi:hypothetical protein